jgi:hypothetical protein
VSLQALLDAQGCATVDALLAQSTVTDQKTVQTTTGAVIGLFNVLQDRPDGDKQLVTLLAALGVLDFDPATVDADLIFGSCQLEAAEEKRYLETRSAASACTASCTDGNRCWCALTSFLASPFKLSLDEETAVSLAQYEGLNVLHICVLMGAFDALQYMFENDLCRYDMKDYVSEKCISPLYLAACVMDTPPYRLITLLCQHGANALMELPTQTMDNVAVKVAASLSSVGKTEEEYNKLLTMATLNIQWLTMVAHAEDVPLNLK